MESQNCIHCGKKLKANKPGHYECYECRSIEEFGRKGGNAPKHMVKKAIKKLSEKPLLWKVIFFSLLLILTIGCMKKFDYKEMSDQKCSVCNTPLKKNKAQKGHNKCFVCNEISKGKKKYTKNGKVYDLVAIQKKSIAKNKKN